MKSEARKMDMLNGSLADKLLLFAIPLAASSILQQLFNAVDVAVVGHFATNPAEATAAVGCNGPVINLIINLFVGISVGANVVVSNFIGAQDKENANRAVHTAMTLALISGVFLLFLALLISRSMLSAMNTPEAVLPYALQYLRIYALGMPFIMAYNFGAAILRSIGDTKRPLLCLVLSGIINAVLNLFLVIVFHLDVAGVAIATIISNVISSVMIWKSREFLPPFTLSRYWTWARVPAQSFFILVSVWPLPKKTRTVSSSVSRSMPWRPVPMLLSPSTKKIILIRSFFLSL